MEKYDALMNILEAVQSRNQSIGRSRAEYYRIIRAGAILGLNDDEVKDLLYVCDYTTAQIAFYSQGE